MQAIRLSRPSGPASSSSALLLPLLLLLAACAAGALGGCSGTLPPTVKLTGVRLAEVTDEASVLIFYLTLTNPNDQPLPLVEFHYRFDLDGRTVFGESRRSAEATIHQQSTKEAELPVVVPHQQAGQPPTGTHQYLLTGRLTYIAPGELAEIMFDTGMRVPAVGFSISGAIDFSQVPAAADSTTADDASP